MNQSKKIYDKISKTIILLKHQNFPLLLCLRCTCLLFFILTERLSFFILLSTCFTLRLSFPFDVLFFLLTTYFFLSFKSPLILSYILLTWRSLLYSVTPYWLITCSACFWVFLSFLWTLIFFLTLASIIFLGTLALIAINLCFSLWNYSLVIGGFLKLCFF